MIVKKVSDYVLKYWALANITTYPKQQVEKKVNTLLDVYTKVFKSKRNTEVEIRKKDNFKSDMGSLFDIASPQAEKILRQDRLLRDPCKKGEKKSKAEEDLEFLED